MTFWLKGMFWPITLGHFDRNRLGRFDRLPKDDSINPQLSLWSQTEKTGFMVIRRQTCQSWSHRGLQNCTWLIFSQVQYFFLSLTRGHSLKLNKNRVRTDLRQHFFSERVINIWNKRDNDTVCASSLASNVIWRNCIKMSHFIDCCVCLTPEAEPVSPWWGLIW